jgi:hypothetical protein
MQGTATDTKERHVHKKEMLMETFVEGRVQIMGRRKKRKKGRRNKKNKCGL